jgi:putative nucleotidyltransferase with HDIG domain
MTDSNPTINEKIKLKIEHSYAVSDVIYTLSENIFESREDIKLTRICGLYHDIGRFEQVYKYNTFWDSESVDHGVLGSELIDSFKFNMKFEDKQTLKDAIYHHNKATVPHFNSIKKEKMIKLTRDADKIDIFRVMFKYYSNRLSDVNDDVSDNIMQKVLKKEVIGYDDITTDMDMYILKFSWLYDINFDVSFDMLKSKGYIEKLYESLPKTQRLKEIYNSIKF